MEQPGSSPSVETSRESATGHMPRTFDKLGVAGSSPAPPIAVSLFRDVCMPRPRMSAAAAIVSKSARSALDSRGVGHRAATHEALSKLSASGAARSGCGGLLALWPLGGGLAMIYLSSAHRLRC